MRFFIQYFLCLCYPILAATRHESMVVSNFTVVTFFMLNSALESPSHSFPQIQMLPKGGLPISVTAMFVHKHLHYTFPNYRSSLHNASA